MPLRIFCKACNETLYEGGVLMTPTQFKAYLGKPKEPINKCPKCGCPFDKVFSLREIRDAVKPEGA